MPSFRSLAFTAVILTASSASAQTNVANYNLNPLSRAYASDSGNFSSRPSGAIDGNTNGLYLFDGTFYHSGTTAGGVQLVSAANPWWIVDLGADYDVSKLVFFYRTDCCGTQNDGDVLRLWASTPDFSSPASALFSQTLNYTGALSDTFILSTPLTARYASIQADEGGAIVFPELQVFGVETAVVATPEPASLALLATGLAGLAGVARRKKRTEA